MPILSVVVPVYNVEQFLRECLDSIINQTLKDIEIICVNDGSTDRSLSIIEEYAEKDKRIKVIDKKNSGYGHSMNVGMEHASGDFIGIVESDDFASPEMFEKLYNTAHEKEAEVVKSNYYIYKSIESIQKQYSENLKECRYDCAFSPIEEKNIFYTNCSIWSGIYKRQFLLDNKIRFNESPGASYQDTSFAFQVWACAEKVVLMRDAFINYRADNAGSSVKSPDKIFCIFNEYEVIEKFLGSKPQFKDKLKNVEMVLKYRAYKGFYNHFASAFQYTFLIKMVEELKKDYEGGYLLQEYFDKIEWDELIHIMNDPNHYFKNTAKDYYDDRLTLFPTLNLTMYMMGLIDIVNNYKLVIIYGAGMIGKKVAQKLLDTKKNSDKLCFAVSDLTNNSQFLLGLPVYCINDLNEDKESSIVLVATKEMLQYDMMKSLQLLRFPNVISIDAMLMKSINDDIAKNNSIN